MNSPRRADRPPSGHEPMFNIREPAPVLLAAILVLCHLGYELAPVSLKNTIYSATVLAARDGNLWLEGRPIGNFATLFTHTLAHGDWIHVLFNAGVILTFGLLAISATKNAQTPVLGRFKRGPIVFFTIFLAGALLGALAQWVLWTVTSGTADSIGASTGGAAIFAAAGWAMGGRDRMYLFMALIVGLDLVVILFGGSASGLHNPAWAGHLGGFIAGVLLAPKLLVPGGTQLNRFR